MGITLSANLKAILRQPKRMETREPAWEKEATLMVALAELTVLVNEKWREEMEVGGKFRILGRRRRE